MRRVIDQGEYAGVPWPAVISLLAAVRLQDRLPGREKISACESSTRTYGIKKLSLQREFESCMNIISSFFLKKSCKWECNREMLGCTADKSTGV